MHRKIARNKEHFDFIQNNMQRGRVPLAAFLTIHMQNPTIPSCFGMALVFHRCLRSLDLWGRVVNGQYYYPFVST